MGRLHQTQGISLITFFVADEKERYREEPGEAELERVLEAIREESLERDGTVFNLLRGFALYEDDRIHVVKPMSARHWTKTAALNDSDEILLHLMNRRGAEE